MKRMVIVAVMLCMLPMVKAQSGTWQWSMELGFNHMPHEYVPSSTQSVFAHWLQADVRYHSSDNFSFGPLISANIFSVNSSQYGAIMIGATCMRTFAVDKTLVPYIQTDLMWGLDDDIAGHARFTQSIGMEYRTNENCALYAELSLGAWWAYRYNSNNTKVLSGFAIGVRF